MGVERDGAGTGIGPAAVPCPTRPVPAIPLHWDGESRVGDAAGGERGDADTHRVMLRGERRYPQGDAVCGGGWGERRHPQCTTPFCRLPRWWSGCFVGTRRPRGEGSAGRNIYFPISYGAEGTPRRAAGPSGPPPPPRRYACGRGRDAPGGRRSVSRAGKTHPAVSPASLCRHSHMRGGPGSSCSSLLRLRSILILI